MSCTPDLGKITAAPFAVYSIVVLVDYDSFSCDALFIVVILLNQGVKITCVYEAQRNRSQVLFLCCVPGTAHVLKGEPIASNYGSQGKSQAQPDGGEGHSVITTGYPVTVPRKAVAPLRRSNTKARGDKQKSS